jgi:hypothetical protein
MDMSLNAATERTANQAVRVERAVIMEVRCGRCTAIEEGSSYEENEGPITGMCCYLSSVSHSLWWKFAEFIIFTSVDRDANTDSYNSPNEATDCKANRSYKELDRNPWDTAPGWPGH